MKTLQIMSAEAEAAAQRYGLLVEGWRALYSRALDEVDFGTQSQVERIVGQAYDMARRFLESEQNQIATVSDQIVSEALTATFDDLGVTDTGERIPPVSEHVSEAEAYLQHEITIQVERDIAFLKQSLRKTFLQVTLAARAQGTGLKSALIQYRLGNASELHFFHHDRRNQRWPSRKFVRAVWRLHLISLYNEVVLLTLADHGLGLAEVRHTNPQSQFHGMLIAMGSNAKYPTYSEIRNEVFHPNSEAILGRVSDVSAE